MKTKNGVCTSDGHTMICNSRANRGADRDCHPKATHTPTPWQLCNTRPDHPKTDPDNRLLIVPNDPSLGASIAQMPYNGDDDLKIKSYANAAFIVRAVNAHEELLAALKTAKAYMVPGDKTIYRVDIRTVEKAITKAEGK